MNLAHQLLDKVTDKHIVVIGDVMVDRWIIGHVDSCQDGCPKFVQKEVITTPGGAGNTRRCLSEWGVGTSIYGQITRKPVKTRYVQDGKILFRVDEEESATTTSGILVAVSRDNALDCCEDASGVVLSDYDKGFLTPDFIRDVVDVCNKYCIPCVADCKRAPEVYRGCILKGNAAWRRKYTDDKIPGDYVITRGSEPPYGHSDGRGWNLSALFGADVSCVNHVGAGDCFAAHLTLALACGFSLRDAATLAHSAGRVYVQHPYSRPPHPQEIAADLSVMSTSTP